VAQPSDGMLRGKWWEIFKDPELNALEEQLNIDNQNIKQFFENFMQARALVREARANQQALINAQVAQMTASVQLIAALGGGWDKSQLPTAGQVAQKPTRAESAIQH
jgi:outer membrane protein TolC